MNPDVYRSFTKLEPKSGRLGGCELLIPEIIATVVGHCKTMYLPFPQSGTLQEVLEAAQIEHHVGKDNERDPNECYTKPSHTGIPLCDCAYFGTPTIVGGQVLFEGEVDYEWNKESERGYVKRLCAACEAAGMKLLMCGLGSGDISPEERAEDMGGGGIVAYKSFDEFEDWLLVRRLK